MNDVEIDKKIDKFLKEKEEINMRKFEYVERIKGTTFDLPKRNTKCSGGYDFYNPETVTLNSGQIKHVKTGVKAYFPEDEILMLCNRSSNPKKKGLILINGVGIVDSDYADNPDNEGEIAFAFMSIYGEPITIEAGEKLGQGIFVKYGITDDDSATGERTGGFGSTGK